MEGKLIVRDSSLKIKNSRLKMAVNADDFLPNQV
jgi:hypothetical protein